MSDNLLNLGGTFNIRREGNHLYKMDIPIPADETGLIGRECPNPDCSPAAFKVKFGTGIQTEQEEAFCPYCRHTTDPSGFMTEEQGRFAKDVFFNEAHDGIMKEFSKTLGLGPNGKRTIGTGMIKFELGLEKSPKPIIRRPREELIRRDVICPHCKLEHAVFGLAVWCPDCGADIFVSHVKEELAVIQRMLSDIDRRCKELGARVAARDIENCLEDVVSIAEATMKALAKRKFFDNGKHEDEVEMLMKKTIRNRFQSIAGTVDILDTQFGLDVSTVVSDSELTTIAKTFEKRHPITHNLGIVDRKYLEKVQSSESEGRDVNLDEQEIDIAISTLLTIIEHVHQSFFIN